MLENNRDEIERLLLDGICEDCDQDPTKCLYQGYCEYQKPKENNDDRK